MARVVTMDFHVTSDCNQECPYCWGPQGIDSVDIETARAIVRKVAELGASRIVFTGGDPLLYPDIGVLVHEARSAGLEVALSTSGDTLTAGFLAEYGDAIDLVSLPLDGASERVSRRTKTEGHFDAIMHALDLLAGWPRIDVKVATPVTRRNLDDVPAIVSLLEARADRMENRVFYNVFQAFPRAMSDVDWADLLVTAAEFDALRSTVEATPHSLRINWLGHDTLDRLYVMVFPDGSLTVPAGPTFVDYGPFLQVSDLDELLDRTDFDALKHQRHARGWGRDAPLGT